MKMSCKNDIAINGRSKKRRQKKLEQTLGKIEEVNVELTNTWKEEIPKIAGKDVIKATFMCKTMIETWKGIGKRGWKFVTTVKLKRFLTDLLFEIIWNIKESKIPKDIEGRDDDLLYKWYLWSMKEIEDTELIEDCLKFENLLLEKQFMERKISEEFVKLRKALDSRLSLKQKENLFGWEIKDRFKLGGEEMLDASDVVKIKEERIIDVGSERNRNRMAARNFKKKKKKEELLKEQLKDEEAKKDFKKKRKKTEEETFNEQVHLMDARRKWMSNKTRKKLRNWLYENTVMASEKVRIDADEDNNLNLPQDLWLFKDVIRFTVEKLDEVLSEGFASCLSGTTEEKVQFSDTMCFLGSGKQEEASTVEQGGWMSSPSSSLFESNDNNIS
jgi:hypothetical protein